MLNGPIEQHLTLNVPTATVVVVLWQRTPFPFFMLLPFDCLTFFLHSFLLHALERRWGRKQFTGHVCVQVFPTQNAIALWFGYGKLSFGQAHEIVLFLFAHLPLEHRHNSEQPENCSIAFI